LVDVKSVTNFTVSSEREEMDVIAEVELQFYVNTEAGELEYAAGLNLANLKFGFQALTDNMKLTFALTQLNVGTVEVLECSWGRLSAASIKLKINNGFRLAKPLINKLLAAHAIQFPHEVLGLFQLTELVITYYDDYIYVGMTPAFKKKREALRPFFNEYLVYDPIPTLDFDASEYSGEEDFTVVFNDELNMTIEPFTSEMIAVQA